MLGARVLLASGGGSASAETLPHRPRCMVSHHARLLVGVRLRAVRPTSGETHLGSGRALGGARNNTFATMPMGGRSAASRRPTNHGGEDGMARDGAFLKASADGCAPSRGAARSISPSTETTETPRTRTVQREAECGFAPSDQSMCSRVRNIYYPSDVGFAPTRSATDERVAEDAARPTTADGTSDVGSAPTRSATDGTSDVGFAPTRSATDGTSDVGCAPTRSATDGTSVECGFAPSGVRRMALPECGFAPSGVRSFPIRLHSALLPAARTLVTLSRQRARLLCVVWFRPIPRRPTVQC
jgi:hypothetical protein